MPFGNRFSIAGLMFVASIACVLFAEAAQPSWRSATPWISLILIELVAFYSCIEILVRNVPSAIRKVQLKNCYRSDGTWSNRRERIELRSLGKLRTELWKAFFLVATLANMALALVHYEVIPIPLAARGMAAANVSQEEWKNDVRKTVKQEYLASLDETTRIEQGDLRMRILWHGWPILLGIAVGSCVVATLFIGYAYGHGVKRLASSVDFRAQQYRFRELHELVGHDDFAKAKSGDALPKAGV